MCRKKLHDLLDQSPLLRALDVVHVVDHQDAVHLVDIYESFVVAASRHESCQGYNRLLIEISPVLADRSTPVDVRQQLDVNASVDLRNRHITTQFLTQLVEILVRYVDILGLCYMLTRRPPR